MIIKWREDEFIEYAANTTYRYSVDAALRMIAYGIYCVLMELRQMRKTLGEKQ